MTFALPFDRSALFLDFDGTLTELAERPDAVQVDKDLPEVLSRLSRALEGALAIVTGRPVEDIDRFFHPLVLPVAGVHGAERRGSDGLLRRMPAPDVAAIESVARALASAHPSLLVEVKPGAVALHYRQAPALEQLCVDAMDRACAEAEGMVLLRGKMVVEVKPRRATKGTAVKTFLQEDPPFRDRIPWFAGDDVTDEAAFETVQSLKGVAIKVGRGETLAQHRIGTPAELREWLGQMAMGASA